ncbi:hypothetical protein FRC03_004875 [Tulasnella sp. 419]|nr:hypothetical protein FRC03_004875 [Tulasnella sp. 419]
MRHTATDDPRFREVDVAFSSVVNDAIKCGIKRMVASYDVACKFKINYVARNTQGKKVLLTEEDLKKISITWLVPKFHLGGHEKKCADDHSFNFTKDVGRTSGELTRYNRGLHQLVELDESNQDVIFPADRIEREYREAFKQHEVAHGRLCSIEEVLPPETLQNLQVDSAQRGGEQYRPDDNLNRYPTRKDAFQALQQAEREEIAIRQQQNADSTSTLSATHFVDNALNIEAKRIKHDLLQKELKSSTKDVDRKRLEDSKTAIDKLLEQHHTALIKLTPALPIDYRRKQTHAGNLTLPSSFDTALRHAFGLERLAEIERKLRIGQAHDILEKTRKGIGLRTIMNQHSKNQAGSGYRVATRIRDAQTRAKKNVQQSAERYKATWKALSALDTQPAELEGLEELQESDLFVLGNWLQDGRFKNVDSDGNSLPWIWRVSPLARNLSHDDSNINDVVSSRIREWNAEGECS